MTGDAVSEFLSTVVEKALPPIITGAIGFAGATWRQSRKFSDRLHLLESAWRQFSEKDYGRDAASFAGTVHALREELESFKREDRKERRLYSKLLERVSALEHQIGECEKALTELNAQTQEFAKEQNDQWQSMTRTLGQLEGYILGMRPSGKTQNK